MDTGRHRNARCAVAFWGKDAEQFQRALGPRTQIICNLESGATNPYVIAAFLKAGIPVKTLATLHAKVYRGTDAAIVGSANCSTNGLAVEEGRGWDEAGVQVTNQKTLAAIDAWLDGMWKAARNITPADIREAKALWKLRRQGRPVTGDVRGQSLLEAMRKNPTAFEDRRIYFVITTDDASQKAIKAARSAGWSEDEFYEDWKGFPQNALLVDMGYDLRNKEGEFQGLYRTFNPNKRITVPKTRVQLTYCPSIPDILGYKVTKTDETYLAERIQALWEGSAALRDDDDGVVLPFSKAKKLLFEKPPTAKPKKKAKST